MQVKKLRLTNAFQHGNLEMDFRPFQAIVGANGSGKSNLIEALSYALTGAFTLPGKIESIVKEGEDNGKIEVTVESEGDLIDISTKLGKSSRSLVRKSKDLKIGKAPEVLEYLERQVLRTPFAIVNSSSIIRQGQLDAGLFDTTAKRTDAFLRMAGLSDIEKKRQFLADTKSRITVPMLSFSVADAEAKIKEIEGYLAKTQEEREAIPAFDKEKLGLCRSIIALTDQVTKAKAELVKLEVEMKELGSADQEAKALLAASQSKLKKITDLEAGLKPAAEKARISIAEEERRQKDWDKKKQTESSMQLLENDLSALLKTNPGEAYAGQDPDELLKLVTEVNGKVKELSGTIEAFSSPVGVCPICRRACSPDEAKAILDSAKAEQAELNTMLNEAAAELAKARKSKMDWEGASATFRQKLTQIEAKADSLEKQLKEMGNVAAPTKHGTFAEIVKQYEAARRDLQTVTTEVQEAVTLANETSTAMNAASARYTELQKQANVSNTTGAVVSFDGAKKYVAEYESAIKKIGELDGLIQATNKQLKDEKTRLEKLKVEIDKAKTMIQYTDYLEFARTALHRDNFPSGKVKAFVDKMLITANLYLDAMQTGFSVSYDKDIGFVAFFPQDNKHMRADRLSGGQKVTFALAFRFAVNDIHTDTGFLILDEPTVYLDDAHIDYLINALTLVKSKVVPRVQIIIVTHDEKLAAVADSVFEVKKN